jgi:hypothetical protein
MWKFIDNQINDPKSLYLEKKNKHSNTPKLKKFRPIRVFVSSTFTDFFNEREILVKQVPYFYLLLITMTSKIFIF